MVISDFTNKSIFLDTAPLIYFIEGQSVHQAVLISLFKMNDLGIFSFVATTITLLEVLVKLLKEGKAILVQQYKQILSTAPGIDIVNVDYLIAEKAANLRAKYNLKTPDAIQLAAAIENNCHYFLTNDKRLSIVTELNIVILDSIK